MASVASILTQKQPQFETQQALIILGLQNEFLSPEGKLQLSNTGFLDRIQDLVPKFRDLAGDIFWIRSEFEEERLVNDGGDHGDSVILVVDEPPENGENGTAGQGSRGLKKGGETRKKAMNLVKKLSTRKLRTRFESESEATKSPSTDKNSQTDDELFLSQAGKGPFCMPGSFGAAFNDRAKENMDITSDQFLITSHYSAFTGTSLLMTLRMKLITELYICGCITNLSVYATAVDAAKHGLIINIVEDCVGYRVPGRHEAAMKAMTVMMGAYTVESADLLWDLDHPLELDSRKSGDDGLQDALGRMSLNESAELSNGHGSGNNRLKGKTLEERNLEEIERALNRVSLTQYSDQQRLSTSSANAVRLASPSSNESSFQKRARQSKSHGDLAKAYTKSRIRMRPRPAEAAKTEDVPTDVPKARPSSSGDQLPAHRLNMSANDISLRKAPERSNGSGVGIVLPHQSAASAPAAATHPRMPETNESLGAVRRTKESSVPQVPTNSTPSQSESRSVATTTIGQLDTPQSRTASQQAPASSLVKNISLNTPSITSDRSKTSPNKSRTRLQDLSNLPTLGPDDQVGEGDTYVRYNLLPDSLKDPISDLPLSANVYHALYHEVKWQKMFHAGGEVPRLVAIQGSVDPKGGSKPVYRHPSDQSPPLLPFSSTVDTIRHEAEKVIGHDLNHVLIQLYRSGDDHISEHSDKTLDIAHGSSIVNASFGARRTMRLRTKKGYKPGMSKSSTNANSAAAPAGDEDGDETTRLTQRIPMPHNSIFVLGLASNAFWLHGIPADKRAAGSRAAEELEYHGMRISLTFRKIATFLSADESHIWGQGARGKTRATMRPVVNGDERETEAMIRAFGAENHGVGSAWSTWYGDGFDVLHFRKE